MDIIDLCLNMAMQNLVVDMVKCHIPQTTAIWVQTMNEVDNLVEVALVVALVAI